MSNSVGSRVSITLDAIKELYDLYSDEETSPCIIEINDNGLKLDMNIEDGPADPYLEL